MALQTDNLKLVGLGVLQDVPPNSIQPALLDGIHLRWAFKRGLGFPWFGFYLFRRPHQQPPAKCLSHATAGLEKGVLPDNPWDTPYGEVRSDTSLVLADDFVPPAAGGPLEFDLDGRRSLRLTFHQDEVARWVEVRIGFRKKAKVELRALWRETLVARTVASGGPGAIVTAILEADAITAVEIAHGPAALIDLCFIPVALGATQGWDLVPDFPYPLRLPVTHPEYPCTDGMPEDLSASRDAATRRIQYGDSDPFTRPRGSPYTDGTIAVVRGSPIVTGVGTEWSSELAGAVLRVDGDPTAYAVMTVLAGDKLVLSREYGGDSTEGATYAIDEDAFGQLHDSLIQLVDGGAAAGPMASRSVPAFAYDSGTISVERGSRAVTGVGTDWGANLAGLAMQIVRDAPGTVTVNRGSRLVAGSGTNWTRELKGTVWHVPQDAGVYTISEVWSEDRLVLDREYAGETGAGKAYAVVEKAPYTITAVGGPTDLTLDRGYLGPTRDDSHYRILGLVESTETEHVVRMVRQRPLDWVLLGALNPAVAQMVGLYWIDQTADPDVAYDYLILADYEGRGERDHKKILALLHQRGFLDVEGYIVFNKRVERAAALTAPPGLRVYALPPGSAATQGAGSPDGDNGAGLHWDVGAHGQRVFAMYHLWRTFLGNDVEPQAPGQYEVLTERGPILVGDSTRPPSSRPQRPEDWPPAALYVDRGLPDGWYGYQVSGIDIFGRHSPNSAAAPWFQWAPPPDALMHSSAIRLLDKTPPPPPTGVEAYVLDPADPAVLKDAAYHDWRAENDGVVGLRVRWKWTDAHRRQAPDIREFRIYYNAGPMNALQGRTVDVSSVSSLESDVETDIASDESAAAYVGARLDVGSTGFEVVDSSPGDPLRVRVRHPGPMYNAGTLSVANESPTVTGADTNWRVELTGMALQMIHDTTGRVSVQHDSPLVTGVDTNWSSELAGLSLRIAGERTAYGIVSVDSQTTLTLDRSYAGRTSAERGYQIFDDTGYVIAAVDAPTRLTLDRPYAGDSNARLSYAVYRRPRANALCTLAIPPAYARGAVSVNTGSPIVTGFETGWGSQLAGMTLKVEGDLTSYRVAAIDSPVQLTLERNFAGRNGTRKGYAIQFPLFVDYARPTKWQERYYVVGYDEHVTIAIDAAGRPLRRYEVFLPAPGDGFREDLPLTPSLSEPIVYASIGVSAADNKPHTLDDSKWAAGRWGGADRFGNEGRVSGPARIFRVRRERPPAPVPPPDSESVYATPADYHGRSYYTCRWRAQDSLKVHVFRTLDDTLFNADWRERPRPPLDANEVALFPGEAGEPRWTPLKRERVASELNALNDFPKDTGKADAFEYYRNLSNDALRVLAGLERNERAFTQITIQPLNPDDPLLADRPGPDNPTDFPVDADLRIYVDTLDGRSTNRYFYRAAYVDGAHNRSVLSLSSPPVYLPDVLAPSKPQLLKVLGGNRRVTLQWAASREPAMQRYLVYRAESREAGRDIRLMGDPLADLPAVPLVAAGGEVDLGSGTDIVMVERVYTTLGFDPSADLLNGQSAQQYLAAPAAPIATRVTGLSIQDRTEVVVVYRDSRGGLQHTPSGRGLHSWIDEKLVGARTYHYRIVATREGHSARGRVILRSEPSALCSGRAIDLMPADPPVWEQGEWIPGPDGTNGIGLVWTVTESGMRCIVQRRANDEKAWRAVTDWLSEAAERAGPPTVWEYRFTDGGATPSKAYEYRIRCVNLSGNTNADFNTLYVAGPET